MNNFNFNEVLKSYDHTCSKKLDREIIREENNRGIAVSYALELLARGYVVQENEEKIPFAPLNPINKTSDSEELRNPVKEIADQIDEALKIKK